MSHSISLLGTLSLGSALAATVILAVHLWRRPPLDLRSKLWLLLGLGALPAVAAASNTAAGIKTTTEREFCGSCHVMSRHVADTNDPGSQTLAARHARNPFFGEQACYVCHADYGMLGYPTTKLNGMRHVYEYYLGGFRSMTLDSALPKIHLYKPYDNTNCRQCHTGTLAQWKQTPEHTSLQAELGQNRVSCASAGCHGYAHPFTKPDAEGKAGKAHP